MIVSHHPSTPYSSAPEKPFVKIAIHTSHHSTGTTYEHKYSDNPIEDILGNELHLSDWHELSPTFQLTLSINGISYGTKRVGGRKAGDQHLRLISISPESKTKLTGNVVTMSATEYTKRLKEQYSRSTP